MDTAGHGQAAPPLLVRWAVAADAQHAAVLLRDVPLDPGKVADLVQQRGVLVLSDLTLPPTAPPVAASAFRLDHATGTAQLAGLAVCGPWRRQGLGRRLLTGTLTLLRAEGLARVHAWARPGSPGASLLVSAGFTADGYTGRQHARSRFVLVL
jgi:GNAT superfamily N-acetyltransferase